MDSFLDQDGQISRQGWLINIAAWISRLRQQIGEEHPSVSAYRPSLFHLFLPLLGLKLKEGGKKQEEGKKYTVLEKWEAPMLAYFNG